MRSFLVVLFTCSSFFVHSQSAQRITTSQDALRHYNEGLAHLNAARLTHAKSSFLQSLKSDEKYTSAMDGLASIYKQENKTDSAIFYYQKSLEIFPRNLLSHQNLASLYILNNEEDKAISQYKALLRHYRGYPEAYLGLARIYFGKGAYEEVIKSAELAMKIYLSGGRGENASEARWLAGKAYSASGKTKKALKYFKACKKYYKEKPFYFYDIGLVYLQMNKWKEAENYINSAEKMGYQIPQHIHNKIAFMNSK